MFKRIFLSLVLFSISISLLFSFIMLLSFSASTEKEMLLQLENETLLLSHLSKEAIIQNSNLILHNRITYIDKSGTVLFDNGRDESEMESHLDRREIIEAINKGEGSAKRYSTTLKTTLLYYALLLPNQDILRVSTSITGVLSLLSGNYLMIITLLLLAISITFLIALALSRHIVKPINNIDLNNFKEFKYYNELSPLFLKIKQQQKDNTEQAYKWAKLDKEFIEVLDSINEGLIILGDNNKIININNSALKIFNSEFDKIINKHYLVLSRESELNSLVECNENEVIYPTNGKYYRMSINEIKDTGKRIIILWDISDKYLAEKMRTEFTANVSHELKTPITVIKGYAELIENDISKKEDRPLFISKIRAEADRLSLLINDIINLSSLDEKKSYEKSNVSVLSVINSTLELLTLVANKKEVMLKVEGEDYPIYVNEKLFFELIYNIVDNAIKYNKKGGRVLITLRENEIEIRDNGIGLLSEDKERIFERFYRVDKSRSKATGGTGLGLSIVKHVAIINDIDIKVDSTIGQGTTFYLDIRRTR